MAGSVAIAFRDVSSCSKPNMSVFDFLLVIFYKIVFIFLDLVVSY